LRMFALAIRRVGEPYRGGCGVSRRAVISHIGPYVSAVTSMHDADHCICVRTVAWLIPKKERLHGYGPSAENKVRRTPVLKDPHDHPFSGAAVRSAKPQGHYLDFRRTDNARVGLARQRLFLLLGTQTVTR
jgi:hypothetical protein